MGVAVTGARCRMTESSMSPVPGSVQSSGAVTVVQSNAVAAVRPVERLLVEGQQLGRHPRGVRSRARRRGGAVLGDQRVEASAEQRGMPRPGPRRRRRDAVRRVLMREEFGCSRGPSARDGHEHALQRQSGRGVLLEIAPRLGDAGRRTVSVRSTLHAAASARSSGSSSTIDQVGVSAELEHQDVAEHRLQIGEHAVDSVAKASCRAALLVVFEGGELRAHGGRHRLRPRRSRGCAACSSARPRRARR